MSQQDQFMLMFSLGPVQAFIAQARKTRDLWLGSYLLSRVMQAAMEGIDDKAFVFPTKRTILDTDTKRNDIPDIPNKYIAIFPTYAQAEAAVEHSKKQITDCWEKIHTDVWNAVFKDKRIPSATTTIWQRQVNPDTLFEFFWVIVESNSADYPKWLAQTQKAFDARKRLRDFQPRDELGEKSTISGEREALRGEGTDRADLITFWKGLTKGLSARDISHDGDERLDAIDVVKRFATKSALIPNLLFPSTSYIATATFVEQLLTATIDSNILKKWQDETRDLIESSEDAIKAIPFLEQMLSTPEVAQRKWILRRDGDLYFSEEFVPRRLEKDYDVDPSDATRIAMNAGSALRELLKATDAIRGISRPTPYYAMIQMDGDKMGILLNGVKNADEHEAISTALSQFSRKSAPKLVETQYPGRLIYAGGDDVFALAPLARNTYVNDEPVTVLDLVGRLQQLYRSTVQAAVSDDKRKASVTASTGIAIAHHFTSLSYVRRVAKASEELAKEHYGRNALVVTVIRRSGEQTRVGCHWHYDRIQDKDGQPIPLFLSFYDLFAQDVLSPKCIYILLEEAPAFVKLGTTDGSDRNAQQSEIKRVLRRQRSESKAKELPNEKIDELAWGLVRLAAAMDADEKPSIDKKHGIAVELHPERRRYGLVEVLGWLLVMAFLARKDQE